MNKFASNTKKTSRSTHDFYWTFYSARLKQAGLSCDKVVYPIWVPAGTLIICTISEQVGGGGKGGQIKDSLWELHILHLTLQNFKGAFQIEAHQVAQTRACG